jgi:two-component system chemotaxis response regulator CheB
MTKGEPQEFEAIVIGGSAGALEALATLLPDLPVPFPLPIAIVLHLLSGKPSQIASVLALHTRIPVRETDDKQPFTKGTIYVAPPNYHLLLEKDRCLSLSVEEPVHFSRPSIDVLFESAADAYGSRSIAVLLSGANEDGALGISRIARAGGVTIVQDPASATARSMPEAALRLIKPSHVLAMADIGKTLARLARTTATSPEQA